MTKVEEGTSHSNDYEDLGARINMLSLEGGNSCIRWECHFDVA